MTIQTPNLQLTEYDRITDKTQNFIDFRDNLAGTGSTSNMSKIDAFAGEIENTVTDLKGTGYTNQTIKGNFDLITQVNSRVTYPVAVTGTNTLVGTITQITTPLNDSILKIYPSATNTSGVTLNINGSGALPITKVQNWTGSTVYAPLEAGDLTPNQPTIITKSPDGVRYIYIGIENSANHIYYKNADNTYTNLQDKLTGITPYTDMNRQAIIDGGFQVAQAVPIVGTLVNNPTHATYPLFDLWKLFNLPDGGVLPTTISHSQQNLIGIVSNVDKMYRITTSGAGASFGANALYVSIQYIENGTRKLCGINKKVTLSFYARSTIVNKRVGVRLFQTYGTGGTPSNGEALTGNNFTLTNSWQRFSYTFTTNTLSGKTFGTNNDDSLNVEFWHMWGSNFNSNLNTSTAETFVGAGDIEITGVQLNSGDVALEFEAERYGDALPKCQRYYEKDINCTQGTGNGGNIGVVLVGQAYFKVQKRITPLVTIVDNVGNSNKVSLITIGGGADSNISILSNGKDKNQTYVAAATTTVSQNGLLYYAIADARF